MRDSIPLAGLALAVLLLPQPAGAGELRPVTVAAPSGLTAAPLPAVLRQEVRAFGPSAPALREPAVQPDGQPALVTVQSVGCLVVGGLATSLTMLAGAENLVNVVGGGLVRAANPQVLALGVMGVTFGTFCAVGSALTPLYLHLRRQPAEEAPAAPPSPYMATPGVPRHRG